MAYRYVSSSLSSHARSFQDAGSMRFFGPTSVRWPMYRLRQSAMVLDVVRVEPLVHLRGTMVLSPRVPVADRAASGYPDQPLQRELGAVSVEVEDGYGQAVVRPVLDPVAR
jgi:hypothetical protein